ncbi:hypothetical protein LLG07_01080 [bacterium]|nr:hypothetical protein [bacterium]
MNIFYETIEKFNDFNSMTNIKLDQSIPGFSISENIINSYDKVLDEKSKLENKQYIEIKKKFELINQEIKDKESIIAQLKPLIVNFQDTYKKKYMEVELQSISQKAFIRIKKEELENYLISYELKLKEKDETDSKKADIKSEIVSLKNKIEDRCREYIEEVSVKNFEGLKSGILSTSEEFMKIPLENKEINSDYIKSEEYLNSTNEYKEAYKKLYYFMSGIFKETQKFIDDSNIEKILPDLVLIQNELKDKYNDLDRLEIEDNEVNDFLILKESYEEALSVAEKELENINGLVNKDEELLALKAEIENYISQNKKV